MGNEELRKKAEPVAEITEETAKLVNDMFEAMEKEKGVGLAAPQVGLGLRIFIVKADDGVRRAFINPQIIATSQKQVVFEEGCLSIPKIYEDVIRPESITIQARNEKGRRFTLEAGGYLARIIQHEYDHLEGILFIDRIDKEKKAKIEQKFIKKAAKKDA
ncbi:peptide deformylase [Brucepastera parasyntrophica]|uniref:peptide deformylase n=1 Tax=Brucepastera parasyntrophica TaxID=2880008 RepID=UPI003F7310F3